jgi:hypothetical protein
MVIFGFSKGFLGQHSALSLIGTGLTENNSPPYLSSPSPVMEEKEGDKVHQKTNEKSKKYFMKFYAQFNFE